MRTILCTYFYPDKKEAIIFVEGDDFTESFVVTPGAFTATGNQQAFTLLNSIDESKEIIIRFARQFGELHLNIECNGKKGGVLDFNIGILSSYFYNDLDDLTTINHLLNTIVSSPVDD